MLGRFLAIVALVFGVIVGAQAPNFTNNFMQNLEGRLDERRLDAERINARWVASGLTMETVRDDCVVNSTAGSNPQGACIEEIYVMQRFESLRDLKQELEAATEWERPILLGRAIADNSCTFKDAADEDLVPADTLEKLNSLCVRDIAENVGKEYEWAIPATPVGFGYAGGLGVGLWALFSLLFGILGLPFRSRYVD